MFEYNYYYDFIYIDKKPHKRPNIHAMHFGRLAGYSKSWNLYDITVFEAFLRLQRRFGNKQFTMNNSHWVIMTRISKNTVTRYIDKMEERGFVNVVREKNREKGTAFHNKYLVDFDKIIESLEIIYNVEDLSPNDREASLDMLKGWYTYLKEHKAVYDSPASESEPAIEFTIEK